MACKEIAGLPKIDLMCENQFSITPAFLFMGYMAKKPQKIIKNINVNYFYTDN